MNNQQNQNTKGKNDGIARINLPQRKEFRDVLHSDIKLLSAVSVDISDLFALIFKDFMGCVLTASANSSTGFDLQLHFAVNANKTCKSDWSAFELYDFSNPAQNGISMEAVNQVNKMNNVRNIYHITKEGKEILAKYIPGFKPETANKDKRWDELIHEYDDRDNYGNPYKAVYIEGFDVNLIIREMYGPKINGKPVQYNITPIRTLQGEENNTNNIFPGIRQYVDWIVKVEYINLENIEKVSRETNCMPINNGIPGLVKPSFMK